MFGNATTSTTITKYNDTSVYFDGSGDTLILPAEVMNFGTGDFTIETWIRPSVFDRGLFRKTTYTDAASPPSISVYMASTTLYVGVNTGSAAGSWISVSNPFTLDTWAHFAIVRDSGTVKIFVDGTLLTSASNSVNVDNTITVRIGEWRNASEYFYGYLEDFRITKGYARYTSTFTPPTAALTEVSGTALLVNGSASGITDATGKTITVIGDATSSTLQTKYRDYSMYFDMNGDALTTFIPGGLGSGDFTVEMWVNHSVASNDDGLFHISSSTTYNPNSSGFGLFHNTQYYIQHDGSYTNTGVVTSVSPLNTWRHIALVRESSTILMFVDGVLVKTLASTVDMTTWQYLQIGEYFQRNTTYSYNGYISDFRIVVGTALYSRNFTPPTAALGFSNAE